MEAAYRTVRGEFETKLSARILPVAPLAREEGTAIRQIDAALAEASHSVHLLGRRYGFIPDGDSGQSIVALQLQRARRRGLAAAGFQRLIWSAPARGEADPKLQALVAHLQREGALLAADHFVEETLERFKSHAIDVIARPRFWLLSINYPPFCFLFATERMKNWRSACARNSSKNA